MKEEKICNKIISKMQIFMDERKINEKDKKAIEDVLWIFQKNGLLDTIDEGTRKLISKMFGNENNNLDADDIKYVPLALKLLFLPCEKIEYNDKEELIACFVCLEDFINWMNMQFDSQDFEKLEKYNSFLALLVQKYQEIMCNYENSDMSSHVYNSLSDIQIITTTLSHLAAILYLYQNEYNQDCQLLEKMFIKILEHYEDFLYNCYINNLYLDNNGKTFDVDKTMKEIIICKKMMDKEYCPPIKLIK